MTDEEFKLVLGKIMEMYRLSPETAAMLLRQILQVLEAAPDRIQKEGDRL